MSDDEARGSDQVRVQRTVTDAEVLCGLTLTVVFCLGGDDLRAQAEREFERLGLVERPQVVIMVEPVAGAFVIDLSGRGRARLSDEACDEASAAMADCYRKTADLADCVERGVDLLCAAAGPPEETAVPTTPLPSVVLVTTD